MRSVRIVAVGIVLALIGILIGLVQDVRDAQAVPAFARKYDFSCAVCHDVSFPKLNDFGNAFRDRGYQLGTDQELPTWEGLTKGYWPVSFRTTVGYQFTDKNKVSNGTGTFIRDQSTGGIGFTGLDILSFGILTRDVSWGIVFVPGLADANFGTLAGGSTSNLESAWLRVDNILGTSLLNVKVGRHELDLPFSERRSPTLNTLFPIYHYVSGTPYNSLPGGANANRFATYLDGRPASIATANNFQPGNNFPGVELMGHTLNGLGTFRYALDALTTNANGGPTGTGKAFQFYGRASQSIGGYGVVSGHRLGIFGIAGQVPTRNPIGGTGTSEGNQPFSRVGADLSLTYGGVLNVFGAWLYANDHRDYFTPLTSATSNQWAQWNGGFVEADYHVLPPVVVYYRYDWIRNIQQGDPALPKDFNNVSSHTLTGRYWFHVSNRTDAAVHVEVNNTRTVKTGVDKGDQYSDAVLIGLDFAF